VKVGAENILMLVNWSLSVHPKFIIRFMMPCNMTDFGPVGSYKFFSVERAFQAVSRRSLSTKPLVLYQANAYGIYDLGTWKLDTFFSLILVFSLHYHSTIALYFFFFVYLTLNENIDVTELGRRYVKHFSWFVCLHVKYRHHVPPRCCTLLINYKI